MRTARILSLFITVSLAISSMGCRSTPDPSIELLESELRWYEEQLYLMNRELASCQHQLESARRFNSSLQREMAVPARELDSNDGSTSNRKSGFPFGIFSNPSKTRNSGDGDNSDATSTDERDFEIPEISHGTEESGSSDVPDASLGPVDQTDGSGISPDRRPPDAAPRGGDSNDVFDEEIEPFELEEIGFSQTIRDDAVSQVVFNPRLTGGHNSDGQPGDDGLYIVLEPRTKAGKYVSVPGELTLEVFSAGEPRGIHSRIARWDFDAAETAVAMRQSLLGKGVHLQLSWPAETPQVTDLVVVAKFVRSDGKRLVAERTFKIDPQRKRFSR